MDAVASGQAQDDNIPPVRVEPDDDRPSEDGDHSQDPAHGARTLDAVEVDLLSRVTGATLRPADGRTWDRTRDLSRVNLGRG